MVRLGKARASQYALTNPLRGESEWPLYRLDAKARVEHLGTLLSLDRGEFALVTESPRPVLIHPPFTQGVYPDVPWFLEDLRPNGFLGRTFAHRSAKTLGVPADLKLWNAEHIVTALLSGGSTQTGDLILGEQSLEATLLEIDNPPDLIKAKKRATKYPKLAERVMRGEPPGSSPGGEQPKFTATIDARGERYAAIVKFSSNEGAAGARRWASLLRCEALASDILASRGIPVARTGVIESAGQVFLESRRFDRTPVMGRRGFSSLASIDAAFYGQADSAWWQLAGQLKRDRWLSAEDARVIRRVSWFGALIANVDMHLGNFGLMLGDELPATVAPVYDMLPMLLRPNSQGQVMPREFSPPVPAAGQTEYWRWGAEAAVEFWGAVQSAEAIEVDVRRFAEGAERAVLALVRRF